MKPCAAVWYMHAWSERIVAPSCRPGGCEACRSTRDVLEAALRDGRAGAVRALCHLCRGTLEAAREYVSCPCGRVGLCVEDGRVYLRAPPHAYDVSVDGAR